MVINSEIEIKMENINILIKKNMHQNRTYIRIK
jgi:hypothetical protein